MSTPARRGWLAAAALVLAAGHAPAQLSRFDPTNRNSDVRRGAADLDRQRLDAQRRLAELDARRLAEQRRLEEEARAQADSIRRTQLVQQVERARQQFRELEEAPAAPSKSR